MQTHKNKNDNIRSDALKEEKNTVVMLRRKKKKRRRRSPNLGWKINIKSRWINMTKELFWNRISATRIRSQIPCYSVNSYWNLQKGKDYSLQPELYWSRARGDPSDHCHPPSWARWFSPVQTITPMSSSLSVERNVAHKHALYVYTSACVRVCVYVRAPRM